MWTEDLEPLVPATLRDSQALALGFVVISLLAHFEFSLLSIYSFPVIVLSSWVISSPS